jgi:signal transduction histidine kinase
MEPWLEHFAATNFRRSSDTAHDLKTPLNIAVLNLELLRMRVAKLAGGEDEKLNGYARAIESELRHMARIFDAFFVLSTPPKADEELQSIDIAPICAQAAAAAGFDVELSGPFHVSGHESRMRMAFKMFFEGVSHHLGEGARRATVERTAKRFTVEVSGDAASSDVDMSKIFKFYYTDASGNADLSLASARLIAETYGGELNAVSERDKVSIGLSFPGE